MKAIAANVLLENVNIMSSRNQGPHFTWSLDSLRFLCGENSIFCRVALTFSCILHSRRPHSTYKGTR